MEANCGAGLALLAIGAEHFMAIIGAPLPPLDLSILFFMYILSSLYYS